MTTATSTLEIRAISPEIVASLCVLDDAGRPPRIVVNADSGLPLRCCLRPSQRGETLALVSYAPLRRWAQETGADPGPYDELGPVFIHPVTCTGYEGPGFPEALCGSGRVLRAYHADGQIARGRLIEPEDPAEAHLGAMFDDPDVALVHVRAVEFGCFIFEARRSG